MLDALIPIVFVVLIWWLGTGIVLRIQQPRHSDRTHVAACVLALATALALIVLMIGARYTSLFAHVTAFLAGVMLWGCIELSYYFGLITGIHERPCPAEVRGWRRFTLAIQTSIWHESVALGIGLLLIALLWQTANPTGLYTFLVLWIMRCVAKLNLYFGVPHFNSSWLPAHLHYLKSYMRQGPVSLFFPVSVSLAALIAIGLLMSATRIEGSAALSVLLPAVLLCLAIVEHLFMALPIADNKLWNGIFYSELSNHPLSGAHEQRGERL